MSTVGAVTLPESPARGTLVTVADLATVLAYSGGLLTHSQALHCGMSRAQIHAQVRSGTFVPLHREVYLVGQHELTPLVRARAAFWAARAGVVSGALAARVHGIDVHRVGDLPEVTLPLNRRRAQRRTLRYRFGDLRPDEVVVTAGVQVTSPLRTLQDLARVEGGTAAVWALEHAIRTGKVTAEELEGGGPRWRNTVAQADPASESPLETAGRLELVTGGFEVSSQHRLVDPGGGSDVIVDLLVAGRGGRPAVAVEADGATVHGRQAAIAQDRRKQHVIQASGLRLVRYTWYDVDERPGWLCRQVRAVQAG